MKKIVIYLMLFIGLIFVFPSRIIAKNDIGDETYILVNSKKILQPRVLISVIKK